MKHYIGLDPGKSGGFVRISDEGVEACPTPTIGDEISLSGVKDWLVSCLARTGRENLLVSEELEKRMAMWLDRKKGESYIRASNTTTPAKETNKQTN
jgi:hypothetical protein